jgi:hypothetical protein
MADDQCPEEPDSSLYQPVSDGDEGPSESRDDRPLSSTLRPRG